jgi:hypothetical protein
MHGHIFRGRAGKTVRLTTATHSLEDSVLLTERLLSHIGADLSKKRLPARSKAQRDEPEKRSAFKNKFPLEIS